MPLDLSVVIPAYNEARRLPATLAGWQDFLGAQAYTWEIVVVDDGSRDATSRVAATAGARVLRLEQNQGKGGAVRTGVLAADGDAILYADADLNVAPAYLGRALRLLNGGADLVVGRRALSEYALAEGPVRLVAGGIVQGLRRALVIWSIQDTQCGFKLFRRELAREIFNRTRIRSFAFDIEALFLARKLGARIVEMPVRATYRAESTFDVRKHLPIFLRDIVQIRFNDLARRYKQ
ncbi:MAG TPA: glycosyltransferase [Chloroflexota bacterium]|nr:glycosyltransferase [Chloroflexota bacterium]